MLGQKPPASWAKTSLTNEGKLLSLSVWENKESVAKWRNSLNYRLSQRQGHETLFDSYAITVASQLRSYARAERTEASTDSNEFLQL